MYKCSNQRYAHSTPTQCLALVLEQVGPHFKLLKCPSLHSMNWKSMTAHNWKYNTRWWKPNLDCEWFGLKLVWSYKIKVHLWRVDSFGEGLKKESSIDVKSQHGSVPNSPLLITQLKCEEAKQNCCKYLHLRICKFLSCTNAWPRLQCHPKQAQSVSLGVKRKTNTFLMHFVGLKLHVFLCKIKKVIVWASSTH